MILRRSEVGLVALGGSVAVSRNADADAQVAWTKGKSVFQQTPPAEAVAQLSRWYGADVRFGDSTLAGLALTMSVANESMPEAVRILAHALDARIVERGTAIVLYARNAH